MAPLTYAEFTVVMYFPESDSSQLEAHFDDLIGDSEEVKNEHGGWHGEPESNRHVWSASSDNLEEFFSECLDDDEARNWHVSLEELRTGIESIRIETVESRHLPFLVLLAKCSISPDIATDGNEGDDIYRLSVPIRNHIDELAPHFSNSTIPGASALYKMHFSMESLDSLISALQAVNQPQDKLSSEIVGPEIPEGIREAVGTLSSHFVLASNLYLIICNATSNRPGGLGSPAFIYLGDHNPLEGRDWPVSLNIPDTPSRFHLPHSGLEFLLAAHLWLNDRNQELSHTPPPESVENPTWWLPKTWFHEDRVEELGSSSQKISTWEGDLSLLNRFLLEPVATFSERKYHDCLEVAVSGEIPLHFLPRNAENGYLSYMARTIKDEMAWQDADLSERRQIVETELSIHETLASIKSTRTIRALTIALVILTIINILLIGPDIWSALVNAISSMGPPPVLSFL